MTTPNKDTINKAVEELVSMLPHMDYDGAVQHCRKVIKDELPDIITQALNEQLETVAKEAEVVMVSKTGIVQCLQVNEGYYSSWGEPKRRILQSVL